MITKEEIDIRELIRFSKHGEYSYPCYYSQWVCYIGQWMPRDQPRIHANSLHITPEKAKKYDVTCWSKDFHKGTRVYVKAETLAILKKQGGNIWVRDEKEDAAYERVRQYRPSLMPLEVISLD